MNIRARGMTLIDVVVGSALVLIIFLALMGILHASLLVSDLAKARAGASSLADSQMEYLRGLSYDELGTIQGIPAGAVPQDKLITEDGVTYDVNTYIQYVDDPADGLGVNDENNVTTDYKLAKVTVSYPFAGKTKVISMLSNFAPPGIETTNGGGTLLIHVVNAVGTPVSGATVHIVNASTTPTIDLTTFSNILGEVILGGAPTSTEYQVYVTKDGFSSAQTYKRDLINQNPTPGYLTVAKDKTTTGTFAIDLITHLLLSTYTPPKSGSFTDTFNDESLLSATSSMDAVAGALQISGGALLGSASSTAISPNNLYAWTSLDAGLNVSSGSGVRVRVYDSSGNIIPDSALPGNSDGFASFPVSLAGVSTSTYPSLKLGVIATTSKTTIVPKVQDWTVDYTTGPESIPNVPFTIVGTKTIGSTGSSTPIYKVNISTTTDASGARALTFEWDRYRLGVIGYDVIDACSPPLYVLSPGDTRKSALTLDASTPTSMLVTVTDSSGFLLSDANVRLYNNYFGYDVTVPTTKCGNAYFGNIIATSTYSIDISKSG
ncbi:MAG TPA: carboxypeptidase regulatory-like domain-containing protein, partial [Candidatus Kaiserbacteria bacterium]|nr:carboxypeptidase regulatory-like domain-containing protein [Candidatus Kaiserbacteria bacterium]